MPTEHEVILLALIESTDDLIWSVDLDYRLITFNSALQKNIQKTLGVQLELGMRFHEFLPSERAALWPPYYQRALSQGPFWIEYSLILLRILELSFNPIVVNGEVTGISVFGKDITEQKNAEKKLLDSEKLYRAAFQASLDPVMISRLEDGMLIEANEAFFRDTGITHEEVSGKTTKDLNIWVNPEERQEVVDLLRRERSCRDQVYQFKKKDGQTLWGRISASLIELDGVPCMYSVVRDTSDARNAARQILDLSFYDPLTHLPNRRLLLDRLGQAVAVEDRRARKRAILSINLDNFKSLNDNFGQGVGDLMLQEVARRLTACVRKTDTVARLGSDEYVVILEELNGDSKDAASQARNVGEKILNSIAQPYFLSGIQCHSSASIGIVLFGAYLKDAYSLLQQADIAMRQAKADGRNSMNFFTPELQFAVTARASMEEEIRCAIDQDRFLLYYQPMLHDGSLDGVEALIRLNHPKRGILAPVEFIPLAEESDLILPLGSWVLGAACAQIAAWAGRKETAHISMAVNVSARQFSQQDFVEQVMAALDRTGANPGNLRLELTESLLLNNIEDVVTKMTQLKLAGLRFSLDDFGTGYSSLSYLRRLPLDQLKIDRIFVRDILTDDSSGAIAQTIISLGRVMSLSVVAEGVETDEQMQFLANLGCHSFQGYLFGRPLPLKDFETWLSKFSKGGFLFPYST
jgi:diguanylate cyclase (GGDEF)-like protein/PAS domain S-box-containing protein